MTTLSGMLHYEIYGGNEHGIVIRPCICNEVLMEKFDLDDFLYRLDGQKVRITVEKVTP